MALGRWAQLADPSWDFDAAFERFRKGYQLPLDATASVRGSQAGEMMARCIVETGTSSYYSALKDATDEPVLKQICGKIAADEFRHYKLFYDHMQRCLERDRLSTLRRLRIGWGRLAESEDDELAYAYFAANEPQDAPYDRKGAAGLCPPRLSALPADPRAARHGDGAEGGRPRHAGLAQRLLTRAGLWFLRSRAAKYAEQGASLPERGSTSSADSGRRIPSARLRRPAASTARSGPAARARPPIARRRIPGRARRGRCRHRCR